MGAGRPYISMYLYLFMHAIIYVAWEHVVLLMGALELLQAATSNNLLMPWLISSEVPGQLGSGADVSGIPAWGTVDHAELYHRRGQECRTKAQTHMTRSTQQVHRLLMKVCLFLFWGSAGPISLRRGVMPNRQIFDNGLGLQAELLDLGSVSCCSRQSQRGSVCSSACS